ALGRRDARARAVGRRPAAAPPDGPGGPGAVHARDVDEKIFRAELIAVAAVRTRTTWRDRIRPDHDGVERIRRPLVHLVGRPAHDPPLGTGPAPGAGLLHPTPGLRAERLPPT